MRHLALALLLGACATAPRHTPAATRFRSFAQLAVEPCASQEAAKCFEQGRALMQAKDRAQESFELVAAACAGEVWDACEVATENYHGPRRHGAKADDCMHDPTLLTDVRCMVAANGSVSGCTSMNGAHPPEEPLMKQIVQIAETSHFEPATWAGTPIESVYQATLCPR